MIYQQIKSILSKGLFLIFTLIILLFNSCAKMGQPDGGWYDETPPRVVSTTPPNGSININGKKISIHFNEFVTLENPNEKVVVCPPQLEMPQIKGQGKSITVELKDPLHSNTTYTIDFSDAISDNNENNPLGNYTYTFSTGNQIDTMEVSGYVVEAENLEPIKGILVGLYNDLSDSAFVSKPMLRIARTDSRGYFTIKGIAKGQYRVYALQDVDGNYYYNQKSEKLAFSSDIITPTSKPDTRQDTIWVDSLRIKDIVQTPYTHFLPDNLVLRAFTEPLTDRFFIKSERKEADHFNLYFSYGSTNLPKIKGLNFNARDAFIIESNLNQDTITYWIKDSTLIKQDTLSLQLQYEATDTLGKLHLTTDTIDILSSISYEKRMKIEKENYDKWKKQQEKNKEKGKDSQTEYPQKPLNITFDTKSNITPDDFVSFIVSTPIAKIDSTKIRLYEKVDTIWYKSKYTFGTDLVQNRKYKVVAQWTPGRQYSLEIDSAAFTDIYGRINHTTKEGFVVKPLEELSTLIVTLQGMDNSTIIVQLLDQGDNIVKQTEAKDKVATFYYLNPDTYYMRLFIDDNNNGKWDTGNYKDNKQAEKVYYYHKEIECKAKWDAKLTWNPTDKPLYQQKPEKIKKQKTDVKQKVKSRNIDRAKSLGIEYKPKIK